MLTFNVDFDASYLTQRVAAGGQSDPTEDEDEGEDEDDDKNGKLG